MQQDVQSSSEPMAWSTRLTGLLLGLLAAGSASSQAGWATIGKQSPTVALDAHAKTTAVVGLERQIRLPDGRRVLLDAEGRSLTLIGVGNRPSRQSFALDVQRKNATLTMLPSGRILIWGGLDRLDTLQSGGLWFDPSQDTLTPAQHLTLGARAGSSNTVLTDGRLLLLGGNRTGSFAETWDERTNISTPLKANVSLPGNLLSAELQPDGRVRLIASSQGRAWQGKPVVFDPAIDAFVQQDRVVKPSRVPGLAGSLPRQDEETVVPDARLALRFTEPLRARELTSEHVLLMGPGGVTSIRLVTVEDGRLSFIQPNQPLFPDSRYSVLIDGIHTAAGKSVPLMTLDFKTAALPALPSTQSSPTRSSHPRTDTPRPAANLSCYRYDNSSHFCESEATLQEGIWTPGVNSTDGRWRVAGSQPELPNTVLMSRITEAVGFTTVMGQIRRVDGVPVGNVEVSIGKISARTDASGRFMLYEAPAGHQELYVDGSTANGKDLEYGQFVVGVDVAKGKLTQLPYTMYLPRITARDKIQIPSPLTKDIVLRHPDIPGLMVQIPAGTVLRDRKGQIVREIAIVPTPVNRAPFPVTANYPVYFTLEPGGAVVQGLTPEAAKGIRVFYPNYDKYKTGTQANFWIYDPADGWRVYGKGRVTSDGKYVSPEAGVALHQMVGASLTMDQSDPPSEEGKPECNEGCGSAQSGQGANAGDPIDLKSGQFSYSETDVVIPDIVPIRFGRSYRPTDISTRSFGLATASSYDIKLGMPDDNHINVVVPSGVAVNFTRTSGSGWAGTWRQTGSVTAYNGATIESGYWDAIEGYMLTFLDGSRMFFSQYAPNYLLWQEDRFYHRTTFTYDAGLLTKITSPIGRYITIDHDTNNRISAVHDMVGNTWSYTYDSHSLLAYVTYPDTTFKHYEYAYEAMPSYACPVGDFFTSRCSYYDKELGLGKTLIQHAIKRITDRRGVKILENDYENVNIPYWIGPVIKQTLPDGSFYSMDYHHVEPNGEWGTLVTNPDTTQRLVTFTTGWTYSQTDTIGYGTPLAQKVTFERGAYQQVTARIDALNRRTEYTYDGTGHVTGVTVLAGTPNAKSASANYDASGNVTSFTDQGQRTTTLNYESGCLSEIIDPLQRHTLIECNGNGQPWSVSDPLGHTTLLQYDGYDLSSVTDPEGRSLQFRQDVQGRTIAMQDDLGNIVQREYDAEGRVTKLTDATEKDTEIDYFPDGRVKDVLLPNTNGITYDYNDATGLRTRTDALGKTESWTVDSMGRVKSYTDRALQQTLYDYDELGRLKTITYPDLSTATPTYDNGNRLRTLVDTVAGTLTWDYNDLDQLMQATSSQGTITYDYDTAGRRWHMTPASQSTIEYQYDDGDRLRHILQGAQTYSFDYDDGDRLYQAQLPNGIKAGYAYNDANQVMGIAWLKPDGSPLADLGYGYNAVGQQIAQTGSLAPQNLPAASTGTNTFDDNNRQAQYNGVTLGYDDNGNLTGDGTRTYVWNARGQLTQVKQGSTVLASYAYDAIGRRSARTEGGATTSYLYDGLNTVQETTGSTVNPIVTGLGIDQRYAQGSGASRRFYLTDALGSTRMLTGISGTVVQRYDYDPYGNTSGTGSVANNYRYTGREQDANGLYYYRARYYNSAMGRFISEDPIRLAGGLNSYAYVGGDPMMYVDPLGLFNWYKGGAAVLNVINAGRLGASGLTKLGIGGTVTGTGVGAAPGAGFIAWGGFNLLSARKAYQRGVKEFNEAMCEDTPGFWEAGARNLVVGALPNGDLADDPNEPYWVDVTGQKIQNAFESPRHFIDFMTELGTGSL